MRLRLILSFTLVVLVTVTSMILFASQGTARDVRTYLLHGGISGRDLANSLEAYYDAHQTWQGVDQVLAGLPGMGPGAGNGIGMGQRMGPGMMMSAQQVILADASGGIIANQGPPLKSLSLTEGQLEEALPLTDRRGSGVGFLYIEGGMGLQPGDEASLINRLRLVAVQAGLLSGGIALLLALFLSGRLIDPIQRLRQAAVRLAHGDMSQRVEVRGRDELSGLGEAFNHMAGTLESVEQERKALTADIAHELRTPLAIQRAQLEALQDGIYPLTPENLQPLADQNYQLTRLVDDLRILALADAGELRMEWKQMDFPALVGQILEQFKPKLDVRQVRLEYSPEPFESCARLMVDPGRVEQILANLMSNALRYTPPQGLIRVSLSCKNQQAVLAIHDSGPGIPEEALQKIFQRFYRGDRSRSREGGGTGLGLTIARQLAQAHGGDLTAANDPQGGATFTLTIPCEPAITRHPTAQTNHPEPI
jgi:signal transduction histidine kinase